MNTEGSIKQGYDTERNTSAGIYITIIGTIKEKDVPKMMLDSESIIKCSYGKVYVWRNEGTLYGLKIV